MSVMLASYGMIARGIREPYGRSRQVQGAADVRLTPCQPRAAAATVLRHVGRRRSGSATDTPFPGARRRKSATEFGFPDVRRAGSVTDPDFPTGRRRG